MRRLSKEHVSYICSECGSPIDGEYSLCDDCMNDKNKDDANGTDMFTSEHDAWCRNRTCNYVCSECQAYKTYNAGKR